jgi:hypothetical protein
MRELSLYLVIAVAIFVQPALSKTNRVSELKRMLHKEAAVNEHRKAPIIISRNKPASQSSDYIHNGRPLWPMYANDGNYAQVIGNTPQEGSCAHTNNNPDEWWRVDLQEIWAITEVKMWNRLDGRFAPVKVEVSNDGYSYTECGRLPSLSSSNGGIYTVPCHAVGRYVRIMHLQNGHLYICEVEVWGEPPAPVAPPAPIPPPPPPPSPLVNYAPSAPIAPAAGDQLISRHKPTSQSSDWIHQGPMVSSLANDGSYNQNVGTTPGTNNCAATKDELYPWWQVDLQGDFAISLVKIWNRMNCCGERLSPLRIDLSDDGYNFRTCGTLNGVSENGKIYSISCWGTGRFLRLTSMKQTWFQLCEVEVWGHPNTPRPIPRPPPVPKPAPRPAPPVVETVPDDSDSP